MAAPPNHEMLAARAYPDETNYRLETIPVPEIGSGEVLVRVGASGLTPGMIILRAAGKIKLLPAVLGHQIAGTVAEVGGGVGSTAEVGQRVRVHANLTCRQCKYCLSDREQMCAYCSILGLATFGPKAMTYYERYHNGGLAQYVRVPEWLLDPLPETISFAVGAKIHDIAGAHRGMKGADLQPGDTLVVASGTGALGAVTVRLAPSYGLKRVIVIGRSRQRLKHIRTLNPNLVETIALEDLGPEWSKDDKVAKAVRAIEPAGADAVIDYTPEGPLATEAAKSLRVGGSLVLRAPNLGAVNIPTIRLMESCWRVVGTRNACRRDNAEITSLLASGRLQVDDLITHRVGLDDVNQGLDAVRNRDAHTWFVAVDVENRQ